MCSCIEELGVGGRLIYGVVVDKWIQWGYGCMLQVYFLIMALLNLLKVLGAIAAGWINEACDRE